MKRIFFFAAAVAAFVSCAKEPVGEVVTDPVSSISSITVEAVAPSSSDEPDMKTTLVDDAQVHWVKGDQVKVMFVPTNGSGMVSASDLGGPYNGASGVLTSDFDAETSARASFSTDSFDWTVGSEHMHVGIAVYPSSVYTYSYRKDDFYDGNAVTVISYDLPSSQTAVANSFQNGVLFSYAEIADVAAFEASEAKLNFKNGCALIRVVLPEDATDIVSVKVESSNAPLSGNFKVDPVKGYIIGGNYYTQYYPIFPLSMISDGGVNHVTLSAPEGETLQAGGSYYVVAWPGTHSNGLTFTFTNSLGLTLEKKVSQEVVLVASEYDRFRFTKSFVFEHLFSVSADSFNVDCDANSDSFTLTSSRDWTAASSASWLTVSPASGTASISPASVSFNAQANTSGARTATITFKAGDDEKTVTVTQDAFTPELSLPVSSASYDTADEMTSELFAVTSNVDWVAESSADWLSIDLGESIYDSNVYYSVAENTTYDERTATITVRSTDGSNLSATFTVTQARAVKTSGFKVVASVLPEDMETGKYYVIANFGDPTKYWTVADDEFYSLSLTGGFSSNAYANEFNLGHLFEVETISKNANIKDPNYNHSAKVTLLSSLSGLGMRWMSTKTYIFNNQWGIEICMGAKWGSDTDDSVDIFDSGDRDGNSNTVDYIHTPDGSSINGYGSGWTGGNGPRKWLIYEVK